MPYVGRRGGQTRWLKKLASRIKYVTLLPSGRGFGRAVEGQVDDALGKSEKKTDGFFSKIGTGIKRVGLGVAALAGTVGTLAIGGGISRALNIEDAQAKLKGLGHDTQSVETIMTNALAAVKGTAFGLDAAATTAASAVASGIKPGQELERYLRLTADAATIAGVSMEEMGSIINKVQAKGVAQMDDLNRLTERGVPILQMLADEYGVTADEMSKMVSKGEVDAERFRKALEDNVAGAALASGDTTRGAFANMRAALSRFGLVFVEDGLAGAKTFFNEITVILDGLSDRVRPWVDKINGYLSGLFEIEGMGEKFLAGFDKFVENVQNGPIPQLLAALAPMLPALGEAAKIIGGALGDAFYELGKALGPELPGIAQALADAVVELAPALTDLLVALVPLIPALAEFLTVITPLLTEAIDHSVPYVSDFTRGLEELISLISGEIDAESFVESINSLNGPLGEANRSAFDTALQFGIMGGYIIATTKLIGLAVEQFWVQLVTAFAQGGINLYTLATNTWSNIVLLISSALQTVIGAIVGGLSVLQGWWSSLWSALSALVASAWQNVVMAVANGVSQTLSLVQQLPGQISAALSGMGSLLFSVGQQMIQGLIAGVSSMIGRAVAAVRDVGGAMLDGVKSFLGIHSPSRVFRDEVGKMVGLGLLEGVEDQAIADRINASVSHMVQIPDLNTTVPGVGKLVDSITINGSQNDRIIQDLMFELRARARGGVYAR